MANEGVRSKGVRASAASKTGASAKSEAMVIETAPEVPANAGDQAVETTGLLKMMELQEQMLGAVLQQLREAVAKQQDPVARVAVDVGALEVLEQAVRWSRESERAWRWSQHADRQRLVSLDGALRKLEVLRGLAATMKASYPGLAEQYSYMESFFNIRTAAATRGARTRAARKEKAQPEEKK